MRNLLNFSKFGPYSLLMKTALLLLLPFQAAAFSGGLGGEFFRNKAYSLAAESYRSELAAAAPSERAAPRLGLAQSYARLGDAPRAAEAYQRFLAEHPAHTRAPEAWLGLALALQSQERYDESQKALLELLAAFPSSPLAPKAAFAKAENLYFLGHFQEAEEAYRRLRDDYPGFERPEYLVYARAWCFFRLSETPSRGGSDKVKKSGLEKAATLFGEVASTYPKSSLAPQALYQQGESYFGLERFKDASQSYADLERRFDGHPLAASARYSLAWCSFARENWKEAANAFHKFAIVHEEHELAPWGLYLAGVSLARSKDYDMAQSAYELTLKKFPGSEVVDKARYGLAWLATVRKDYPAAIGAYEEFLKNFPASELAASALFLKADSLYRQERYASAREDYLRLLKNYPGHKLGEDALFFVAGCSLAQGEYGRALDEYQQFRRLRPDSPYLAEAALREADAYYGEGQWDQAEKGYAAVLKKYPAAAPQIPPARSGLAWISFSRKRWEEARSQWKRLADDYPAHPLAAESLLHAGDSLFNMGRYEEALGIYRAVTAKAPGSALENDAHFQAGWCHFRLKRFDQAYNAWGAAAASPKDESRAAESLYWMAWALFRREDYAGSARAFADMRDKYPKSHLASEALLRQADSLYNSRSYEEAVGLYKDVVAKYPGDPKAAAALHGIQWSYYSLGRDEEAIAASKAFLEKHKDSEFAPEVQYRVAEHYLSRSDFKQAEKELDTLKTAFPSSKVDLTATYWRGQARFKNLKFNDAIRDWRELVEKAPSHSLAPKALFKVGLAYYRLQEYPEALAAFNRVLDSYANTKDVAADARFNIGMTFKRMHRDEDAIQAYEKVISDYPGTELANMSRIRIGYIHEDRGDYAKAAAAYRELAAVDPGKLGAEAQYLVGDCLLAQKKSGEALLAYREVVERFQNQEAWVVTAMAKIGEVEEGLGHDLKAMQAYQAIVDKGGDPSWVESAKKRIGLIRARHPEMAQPATGTAKPKPKPKSIPAAKPKQVKP